MYGFDYVVKKHCFTIGCCPTLFARIGSRIPVGLHEEHPADQGSGVKRIALSSYIIDRFALVLARSLDLQRSTIHVTSFWCCSFVNKSIKPATEGVLAQRGMELYNLQHPSAPPLSRGTSTVSWTTRHRRKRSDSTSSIDTAADRAPSHQPHEQHSQRRIKPLPPSKHGRPRGVPNDIR